MSLLFFEDFPVGFVLEFGVYEVTRDEIIRFASAYDPQPFHLDEAAAAQSMLGGLAASGWHTMSMTMRLHFDAWLARSASLGSPGVQDVRWLRPVHPGDFLSLRLRVEEARASKSWPSMGLLTIFSETLNQRGECVASARHLNMLTRRDGPAADASRAPRAPERSDLATKALEAEACSFFGRFDDLVIGQCASLGTYAFNKEEMVSFARAFDPQPFHIDENAAKASHFGGLVASGWHVASGYMRRLIEARHLGVNAARAKGLPSPDFGPSPGFRDLRWILPVYAGDRITYYATATDKRPTSRKGWGLVFADNVGVKQDGTKAFEFASAAFYPMRSQDQES